MVNANFCARSATVFTVAVLAGIVGGDTATMAQERQGCFMVDASQQLVELDDICPTPPPFLVSGSGEEGLGTGDIQVTLRWATTDDLDLAVTGADGQRIDWEFPGPSGTGGTLDRDDNSSCVTQTQSPIENIFWPPGQAPNGSYTIEVNLFQRCAFSSEPIDFEIRLLVQGTTDTITGTVSDDAPTFTYDFSLPVAGL